jgi:FkbM family methyltransferase
MSLVRTIAKTMLPPPVTIRLRAAFKHHELERALLPALCEPGKAGLDIGAALGAYTWPLAKLCATCIAFEPNPTQARYLREAFGSKVHIENVALSDRDGETELFVPLKDGKDQSGWATIAPGDWIKDNEVRRLKVPMRTLDSFQLKTVGFIKLDVEGHELAVLQGGSALLQRDRPKLLVELEERFGEGSILRVREHLEALGYRGLFLDGGRIFPIAEFDAAKNQTMTEWGKLGTYINNFMFVSSDRYANFKDRLFRLGYPLEA